jgi:DUF2934 family protein
MKCVKSKRRRGTILASQKGMDTAIHDGSAVKTRRRPDRRSTDRTMIISTFDISRRAYELFLERGGEHGHDLEDWLRAEGEIIGRITQP